MNIGMGLLAADAYFKEDDARKVREYDQAKRDSELRLLPEYEKSQKTAYGLQSATNQANTDLVPHQQKTNEMQHQADQGVLAGQIATQPTKNQTDKVKAGTELKTAEHDASTLADRLYNDAISGKLKGAELQQQAMGHLALLAKQGHDPSTIAFLNRLAPLDGSKKTVRVQTVSKGGVNYFQALAADGSVVFQADENTMVSLLPQEKDQYHTLKPGDTLVRNGQEVFFAPETESTSAEKQGPLERDVNYLVRAHGMTPEQARVTLQSSKTKSRPQFIMDQVNNLAAMGKMATPEQLKQFGDIYDAAAGMESGKSQPGLESQPGSNSEKPTTLNPKFATLFGIPPPK